MNSEGLPRTLRRSSEASSGKFICTPLSARLRYGFGSVWRVRVIHDNREQVTRSFDLNSRPSDFRLTPFEWESLILLPEGVMMIVSSRLVQAGPSSPLVSVVMAVYKPHPIYFPEAVRSVLAQTISDLELVIVEDPSPACGVEMLKGIADARVRHFVNPIRTHLVAQRNRCLAEARSDLVATLDADDISEPDRLERQLNYLGQHPDVAAVGSQLRVIVADGRTLGYRAYPLDDLGIRQAVRRFSPMAQNTVLFRKPVIQEAGGYQFSYNNTAEDYDLWSRLACRGRRMANLPYPLVRYRIHPGQMKNVFLRDTIRGVVAVKRRYWAARMTTSERAQLWAESVLPYLPSRLVLAALIRWRWLSEGRPQGAILEAGRFNEPRPLLDSARSDNIDAPDRLVVTAAVPPIPGIPA